MYEMISSHKGRGRRHGQNIKDFQASCIRSLHPGARDSREKKFSPATTSRVAEKDILAPPIDSDDSDAEDSGNSDATPDPTASSALAHQSSDEDDAGESEIFGNPIARTQHGKRSYSMTYKNTNGTVTNQKRRQASYGMGGTTRFQPVPPPYRSTGKGSTNGFIHVPPAVAPRTSNKTRESQTFVAPPEYTPTTSRGGETEFVDPMKALESHPSVPRKVRSAIRDDLDDYLDHESRKKKSKSNGSKTASSATSYKSKPIEPEAIFMLPPPSSLVSEGEFPDDELLLDIDNEEVDFSDSENRGSQSSYSGVRSSNTSVPSSQSNRCPICQKRIESSLLNAFQNRHRLNIDNRLTVRQQELLHLRHAKIDAESLWKQRSYPSVHWGHLNQRLNNYEDHVTAVIEGHCPSYYRTKLRNEQRIGGRKTTTLAEEMKSGQIASKVLGYYGTRGQRILGDWLLSKYSTRLKQRSRDPDVKLAGGVSGFTQKVLIPELIQYLITADMTENPTMRENAERRANSWIRRMKDDPEISSGLEAGLNISVNAAFAEVSISEDLSELDEEELFPWLARFIAIESAECGILLSEEIADVVPMDVGGD